MRKEYFVAKYMKYVKHTHTRAHTHKNTTFLFQILVITILLFNIIILKIRYEVNNCTQMSAVTAVTLSFTRSINLSNLSSSI